MKFSQIALSFIFTAFTGCTHSSDSKASSEVRLAIWSNYVTDSMMEEFQKQSGLKPIISNYSSNEELLAKLQAGATGFDVVVPSDYMVEVMIKTGLLEKLNTEQLSHFSEINPNLKSLSYDPDNSYSVPLNAGTTGMAVNKNKYAKPINSWQDVFSDEELKGKFTLLDDVRETLGIALRYSGTSINSSDKSELASARDLIIKLKPSVKSFDSEVLAGLINGEIWLAHAYSSDALKARRQTNGAVQYILPAEGCTRWVDNLVIPKGAQNPEGALKLIDFLLSAEISAQRAEQLAVIPANSNAKALLPQELQDDMALFPKDEVLAKCEMIHDLGSAISDWDRAWTEAKAAQ